MIINYRTDEFPDPVWATPPVPFKILVNGVEISHAWFIDTDAGVVKSHNWFFNKVEYVPIPDEIEDESAGKLPTLHNSMSFVYRGKVEIVPR